jgi:hypothetical protein
MSTNRIAGLSERLLQLAWDSDAVRTGGI